MRLSGRARAQKTVSLAPCRAAGPTILLADLKS
jgi:hypothetical protein